MQPDGRVILQHSMASLSLKSGALTGLRAPAASCVCFSAKPEPICSFNPHSLAPNAAIRLSRRCRLMPASFSMTARAVANGSSPSRAIAACSALMVRFRVRRYKRTRDAANSIARATARQPGGHARSSVAQDTDKLQDNGGVFALAFQGPNDRLLK